MTDNDNVAQLSVKKFNCSICNFGCSKKCDWDRHIISQKHTHIDTILKNNDSCAQKTSETKKNVCDCGKEFSHRQSLFVHKKKCEFKQEIKLTKEQLIENLIKENEDLRNIIVKMCKQMQQN